MAILQVLQDQEVKYGVEIVRKELTKVAIERDAPHVAELCVDCRISPSNDWNYCPRSTYHVDHPRHVCPLLQECDCCEDSE